MIKNVDYKLKKDATIVKDVSLPAGQIITIVMDVVYVNGYMVAPAAQPLFYKWIVDNPTLFDIVTRNW